jgi:phosphopantetheinyl transferase (holo-ACP synthase)
MPVIDLLTLRELPDAADPRWRAWLTVREFAACTPYARAEEHLAARVAGKLALARELGLTWPPPRQDLEIGHQLHGPPPVVLPAGCGPAGLSLSHAAGYAAALAWSPTPTPTPNERAR